MASYVTVTQTEDDKKWAPVAMMYDSGTKEYHNITWTTPSTNRNNAVAEARLFAIDNNLEFIS